jgi:hypothetical protein
MNSTYVHHNDSRSEQYMHMQTNVHKTSVYYGDIQHMNIYSLTLSNIDDEEIKIRKIMKANKN